MSSRNAGMLSTRREANSRSQLLMPHEVGTSTERTEKAILLNFKVIGKHRWHIDFKLDRM